MENRGWRYGAVLVTLSLAFVAGITSDAVAAEVKVLSGGAVKAAVTDLAEAWGRETGHRVTITYATTGASMQKLAAGEPADVVILATEAIDQLASKGTVNAGTKADVARVGIGVAVREDAPKPDISTPEAVTDDAGGEVRGLHGSTKGVAAVGPLPRDQKVTVYAAAVTYKKRGRDTAMAFIAFLMAPAARPVRRRRLDYGNRRCAEY
jgi:ABC-type molybdate transport system substrate-binding protein